MRLSRLCAVTGLALLVLTVAQFLLQVYLEGGDWNLQTPISQIRAKVSYEDVSEPVVLWWSPLGGSGYPGGVRRCGQLTCYFTDDRAFWHHPLIQMLVFYGSNMNLSDMPLPRRGPSLQWALLHEESPRNNAAVTHLPLLSLFNHTATVSRHSSFPLTTQYLSSLAALTDIKYFVPTEEKSQLQRVKGLAPVVYLQSDCSTPTDRDSYVAELSRYIPVHSYGACLHNRDLPPSLQPPHSLRTMMSDELLNLVAQYKFMIAIENGVCHDYITEKLWRPLIAGTVPVYIGSPTVIDWLPNNRSAVLGLDFAFPKDLAEYLMKLNNDDSLYERHLRHKLEGAVSNSLLVDTMKRRQWTVEASADETDFLEAFECFLCENAHSPSDSVATQDHYRCPIPESTLSRAPNASNYWLDDWFLGRCKAELFRQMVDSGGDSVSQRRFEEKLKNLLLDDKCYYSQDNMYRYKENNV